MHFVQLQGGRIKRVQNRVGGDCRRKYCWDERCYHRPQRYRLGDEELAMMRDDARKREVQRGHYCAVTGEARPRDGIVQFRMRNGMDGSLIYRNGVIVCASFSSPRENY